jgi:hypothetical protein
MADKIEIEKRVPVPPMNAKPGGLMDTVRKMKVGDSFIAANRNFVGKVTRETGFKLVTRKTEDGRFRIWRAK